MTGMESRLEHHQREVRRAYPIERMSCPLSPTPTLQGEERCLTFDYISAQSDHAAVGSVSAEETTNEWRDVGCFSDKERTVESRSAAVTPVYADEGTSGWRDLGLSSENERTEDATGQTDRKYEIGKGRRG